MEGEFDPRNDPVVGLRAYLAGYVERTSGSNGRRGCLLVATAMELAGQDAEVGVGPLGAGVGDDGHLARVLDAQVDQAAAYFADRVPEGGEADVGPLLAALVQFLLNRHHKKEKAFGPSPTNGYTAGTARNRKFWQRKPKTTHDTYRKDAEAGLAVPAATTGVVAADRHHHSHEVRPSHDTSYTDRTAVAAPGTHPTFSGNKYDPNGPQDLENAAVIPDARGSHGYYTAPTGTAVNPYGYAENNRTAATNY